MTAYAKLAIALAVLLAGFAAGWVTQGLRKDASMAKYVAEHTAAENAAIIKRTQENAAIIDQQTAVNAVITKAKDEETARTIAALNQRLRRGAGICAAPAGTPVAESASGSDGASSTGGLFREDIQRDFAAGIAACEGAAATARAAQSFIRANGLEP